MSRPIMEPSGARAMAALGFGVKQLLRRPIAVSEEAAVSWMRFERLTDVTYTSGDIRNPFIDDTDTMIEESINNGIAMEAVIRDEGANDRYVALINEQGIYTTRLVAIFSDLTATTIIRINNEAIVLQETIGGNQRYGYTELTSTFSTASIWDSMVVLQEDIDATSTTDPPNNVIQPRIRHEAGADRTLTYASWMIWRIPAALPGEGS